MPKISIIIPVFNREKELLRALHSTVKQTFSDFEVLVIDDGSTTPIEPVCDSFHDKRIKYSKTESNHGVSYARNRGISTAASPLIALLDSDDEWLPDKLARQVDFLEEYPRLNCVHTEEIWIRNGRRVNQRLRHRKSGGDIFERSLELCLMSPSSIILRTAIIKRYGLFDESLPVCEDYDMWLRITSQESVGFIKTPLTHKYGGHADQLSRAFPAMDRYRVLSMIKLLQSDRLSVNQIHSVKQMIIKKTRILLQGAEKRDKQVDISLYTSWLAEYESN